MSFVFNNASNMARVGIGVAATVIVIYIVRRYEIFGTLPEFSGSDDADSEEDSRLGNLLIDAAKRGSISEVEMLLAAGAQSTFQSAQARKHTRIGLSREHGQSALHWAAIRGLAQTINHF